MDKSYRTNHYVPQWYQKLFIPVEQSEKKLHYLNLKPTQFSDPTGQTRVHNALRFSGTRQCFAEKDLYTTIFGGWESTEMEQKFFGEIDSNGMKAIKYFQTFSHPSVNHQAFSHLLLYLSTQKLRTPKGLEYLKKSTKPKDNNDLLITMQRLKRIFCAIWAESIWVIADASKSSTKFIISDHPVTVYNMGSKFPVTKWCRDKKDPDIWQTGTHTLFPLNPNKILIITNQSWVRNPYGNPNDLHPNPQPFRDAFFDFTEIQTGRMLTELDVQKINYIIKKRAYRYIAATNKEWLYPEKHIPSQSWQSFGKEYLLMPDPRLVKFTTSITLHYTDKTSLTLDAFGRKPYEDEFQSDVVDDEQINIFNKFQKDFSNKFGPKLRGRTFHH